MTVLPDVELHFLPLAGLFLFLSSLFLLQSQPFPPRNKEKYSLKISTSKTPLKNMFQKSFPAVSHNHFSDQKKGHTILHNYKIDLRNRPFRPSG